MPRWKRLSHAVVLAVSSLLWSMACSSTPDSAPQGSGSCASLDTCCNAAAFPASEQPNCLSVVSNGTDEECSGLLTSSTAAGLCGTTAGEAGSPQKTTCQILSLCCESFPSSSKAGCNAIAGIGSATDCAQALAGDEMAALCSGLCATTNDCSNGQACNLVSNHCVACIADAQCSGATPACDLMTNKCVECNQDAQCPGADPSCVTSTHTCLASCSSPSVRCGDACATLATDAANCGKCGESVPSGFVCVNGAPACPSGSTQCGSACVDTSMDNSNCGSCDHSCTGSATCQSGKCEQEVDSTTLEDCNSVCGSLGCISGFGINYTAEDIDECDGFGTFTAFPCDDVPPATMPDMGCYADPFQSIDCYCGS